ncbi:hypothetical protein AVEN_226886-1 [Araneus ventricosus]|uniref:Uncharacterized protein n=1 Tax=Araneus ventricosus TaxID=182803 RepID=A0A4Y2X4S2_ARAVE|nr:hypothetical protein AVEN_226886-1 [Araneus ventricosus]
MFLSKASGNVKRKSDQSDNSSKKLCVNDRMEVEIRMDSLPKHMIHFGDGLFTLVNSFLKETRGHIRVYSTDDKGILHPTKEGVSLKPEVLFYLLFAHFLSERIPMPCL